MKNFKTLVFFFVVCLFSQITYAQDTTVQKDTSYWKKAGSIGLNFANVGLSNWAAGGVSSISLGTVINLSSDYAKGANSWKNSLLLAYGVMRQGGSEAIFKKTDDNLILASQYGHNLGGSKWSWIVGGSLRTQIADGYLFAILNTGVEYNIKDIFSVKFAPLTWRMTIVNDDALSRAGAFGVEAGKKTRSQFGWTLSSTFKKEIVKNVTFQNVLNLFGDYARLGVVVVNWETLLVMKVNKYITTNFGTQLIYDHDVNVRRSDGTVGQAVQFKHVLNVGLAITL
ncbi:MAG: DUF3078 domain-containing protein [Thermoflexibacter sp.]|nr:DUF3078 domain-containing protein [Thermoflexibacter sp.]